MKILLGITGGIAAYKAADLARLLTRRGHVVRCCLTDAGARFITPLTLATLTGQPCFGANPDHHEWRPNPQVEHVDLARWADVAAVVPATAHSLAKTANGLAPDLLSTLLLATTAKVLWAPAMNQAMWAHPAVRANIERLQEWGHVFVMPVEGLLACGEEGDGKLADVVCIAEAIEALGSPRLKALEGKRVLVTAGPTREDLDPARTLTNKSSGATGVALARALRNAGAQVHLVLGGEMDEPWGVKTVRARSAQDMLNACLAIWPDCDGVIAAAAVADQCPAAPSQRKTKKQDAAVVLELIRTPDVLAALSASKRSGQWLVGFAAESEDHVANALAKLHGKGLDAVFVNDIADGKGFGPQANTLVPVTVDGPADPIGPLPKDQLAEALVAWWAERLPC